MPFFKSRRKNNIFIVIAFLAVVLYFKLGAVYTRRQLIDDYTNFDSTEINGILKDVGYAHGETEFRINSINRKFIFAPYTSPKLNSNTIFKFNAQTGDSIVKHAHADTLLLFKSNKIYKYLFNKKH